ncbi:MAG: TonB-dependent receptor, partial [Ignavibacteriales bacterium]|nr:TonB-dependent receptor [Ignavibacteriales bacterium]
LHYKTFTWTDSKTIIELLKQEPEVFIRDLGEAGKLQQLWFNGVDDRGITVSIDGRPMNDPLTGKFNLYHLALEGLEYTELLTGSRGVLASPNSVGGAINAVSRHYNSLRPMTKIRYVQEPNETLLTDGLFTQNVARAMNLMFGFTRQASFGRYKNSALDEWNIRSRLRYNVSERLNVALTYFYTKAVNGMHGGVDPTAGGTAFDEKAATLVNEHASETDLRTDWTLSAIAHLLPDTSFTTQLVAYTTSLYHWYDQQGLGVVFPFTTGDTSEYAGVRLQQQARLGSARLLAGIQTEKRSAFGDHLAHQTDESLSSLFARIELPLGNLFTPSISLRHETVDGDAKSSYGLRIRIQPSPSTTLFAEATSAFRFPTMQEMYWRDSTLILARSRSSGLAASFTGETHKVVSAGAEFHSGEAASLSATVYHRTVSNAIVAIPASTPSGATAARLVEVPEVSVEGFSGRAAFRFWNIELLGSAAFSRYTEADTVKTLIPNIVLFGEAAYRNSLLNGALEIRAGVRSRFENGHQAQQLLPIANVFYQSSLGEVGRHSVIDLFTVLHVGQAFISLTWQNITNAKYVTTPIYPMPTRQVRLGVNWIFLD